MDSQPRVNPVSGAGSTDLGGVLRGWRRACGLTLKQLAQRAGCTPGFLSGLENGHRRASAELLGRLETALGLHPDELRVIAHTMDAPEGMRRHAEAQRRQNEAARELAAILREAGGSASAGGGSALDDLFRSGRLARLIERVTGEPWSGGPLAGGADPKSIADRLREASDAAVAYALPVEVPVINSVAAGYPTEFTDLGYPARVADSYVRQPDIRDPDAFAARVVGDSMEPAYREGDIVVFSPARAVLSGMDCFVRIEPDHETTFKRVYFEEEDAVADGPAQRAGDEASPASGSRAAEPARVARGSPPGRVRRIRLQPLNPKYPSRVLDREDVAGLYAAVSVTRMIGGGG